MWMAERPAGGWVLQVSPNDHPPFQDICASYRLAFESLGLPTRTLFLSPPVLDVSRDVSGGAAAATEGKYLAELSSANVRSAVESFSRELGEPLPQLVVCHRYRSYRVLRASSLAIPRMVVVAHEFGFFKRLQRRVERALFARHVQFAGVSPAVQAELGETVAKPLYLPNALDLKSFEGQLLPREAALEQLGLVPGPYTIGLVGRLVPKKQPLLAIEALRRLLEYHRDVRLVIIGDGELRGELESVARGLPVSFAGFVPDARRLLNALDVMLLTSRDVEAFGMVALEAMASGVPVIAGPTPGPQSVLGGAGYYYHVPDAEHISEALREVHQDWTTGQLQQKVQQGRQRAQREFSIAALAERLDELFFSLP
jgi:glycosyltransferase involved in cell wall biosynthesis